VRKKVKNIALKTSTKKNEELEDKVAESSESEKLNLLVKRFGKISKGKVSKVIQRGILPNTMNQILLILHVITVENKDISKLNVQMLTKKRRRVLIGKKRRSQRRNMHTLHGRTMMIQQQVAPHKIRVKKPTCVSWLVMSHPPQAK